MARFVASLFAACLAISIRGARADTAFTQTAPRPPLPLAPYGKLAAKNEHRESVTRKKQHRESTTRKRKHRESVKRKREHRESAKREREHRESAKKNQKRTECEEQAQKLL